MEPIGVVVGFPSRRSLTFRVFVEHEDRISVGDFVRVDGVIARVSAINRHNLIKDERLISQLDDYSVMRALLEGGFAFSELAQYTTARALVLGRSEGATLRPVTRPPRHFAPVYPLPEAEVAELLAPRGAGPHLSVGHVRGYPNIPAMLDANRLVTQHCAILAATGGGKSWLAGLLAEEAFLASGIPIIIIDPHGEYSSMQVPRGPEGEEVSANVHTYVPGKVDTSAMDSSFAQRYGVNRRYVRVGINPRSLGLRTVERLLSALYGMTDAQRRILEEGWPTLRGPLEDAPLTSLDELIEEVVERGRHVAPMGYAGEVALHGLKSRLSALFSTRPIFISRYGDSYNGEPIRLLRARAIAGRPGIHVMDLSGLDVVDQRLVTSILLDEVFLLASRREVGPLLVIVEEAHIFAPSGGGAISLQPILRIAREGRKFGVGLCMISQRPSKVHPDALSQCMTQIFKRMINPRDLKYVELVAEHVGAEELAELRNLSEEEALVTGVAVSMPMVVKVGDRRTQHGGAAPVIVPRRGN